MKRLVKNITPGLGLGDLKFGISMSQARQILGNPHNIEKYSYTNSKKDLTETWNYKEDGIRIGFDQEDDWKLILITIDSESYKLFKTIYLGLEKNQIISILKDFEINDLEYEDVSTKENPTHELLSSDSLGINFWFDNGKMTEIQISPLFLDDMTINWPK